MKSNQIVQKHVRKAGKPRQRVLRTWMVIAFCIVLPLSVLTGCKSEEVRLIRGASVQSESSTRSRSSPSSAAKEHPQENAAGSSTASEPSPSMESAAGQNGKAAAGEASDIGSSGGKTSGGGGKRIYVYICGEIKHPGVYSLAEGSRVFQLVELAGGLTEQADPTRLNQAEILADGMNIIVERPGEAQASSNAEKGSVSGAGGEGSKQKININRASAEQLMELPGIGEAKAKAIIESRKTDGAFRTIEDIKRIEGIKEKAFAKLKPLIKV